MSYFCFVLLNVPYIIMRFDNVMFSVVLLVHQLLKELQKDKLKGQCQSMRSKLNACQ